MSHKKLRKAFSLLEVSAIILIIGLLLAAITQGSHLYAKSKLATARNITDNSEVHYTEGLLVWLDATATEAFDDEYIGDGDTIAKWTSNNNRSILEFNVEQDSDPAKPTYNSDGINGLPAVVFDGSNDVLTRSNTKITDFSGTNTHTTFVVQYDTKDPSSEMATFTWTGGSGEYQLRFPYTNSYYYDFYEAQTGGWRLSGNISSYVSQPNIITMYSDGVQKKFRINGKEIATTSSTNNISSAVAYTFYLGSHTGPGQYFGGKMGELIFFDRGLTDDQINEIELYLSEKWGIALES